MWTAYMVCVRIKHLFPKIDEKGLGHNIHTFQSDKAQSDLSEQKCRSNLWQIFDVISIKKELFQAACITVNIVGNSIETLVSLIHIFDVSITTFPERHAPKHRLGFPQLQFNVNSTSPKNYKNNITFLPTNTKGSDKYKQNKTHIHFRLLHVT